MRKKVREREWEGDKQGDKVRERGREIEGEMDRVGERRRERYKVKNKMERL